MPLIAFYFCYSESVFMQKNKISHTRHVTKIQNEICALEIFTGVTSFNLSAFNKAITLFEL